MYMLERKEPKPIRAIGNTCTIGYISFTWKQVAMSEDLESLKAIMGKNERIINWNTLEVIHKSEETW
jgi:hypothetical protein